MASEFPDTHNIMSKKIAQLTKVIFFLNTRSDDNDSITQNIIASYEQEMDNIVESANKLLQKQKAANDLGEKFKGIEKDYEDFRERIENERIKAGIEYSQYKRTIEEKERDLKTVNEKKMNAYEQEINNLRSKLENIQKALNNISEDSNGQKAAHQKEFGDFVKKQNEK